MAVLVDDIRWASSPERKAGRGIRSVLVAFDGSDGAWDALSQAIAIAVREHALLTIAGVVANPPIWIDMGVSTPPYTRQGLRQDAERQMQQWLAAARDEVPATLSVTTQLLHGRPARALAELAEEGDYDLVVTGPRPAGRLRRALRGGVTRALVARCRVSVLAIRA